MNWFGYLLVVLYLISLAAIPATVVYGLIWWRGIGSPLKEWRAVVSKVGVVWSAVNLLLIVSFFVSTRIHPLPFNDFNPAYSWARRGFLAGSPGVIFAALGKGRVRAAFGLNALSSFWFWLSLLSTL
jgi:hypothetical protein